jgi:signal transduction histidine kinase
MEANLVAQARITAQTLAPSATALGPAPLPQASAANTLRQQQTDNIVLQTGSVANPNGVLPRAQLDLGYLANSSLALSAQLDTHIRILDVGGIVVVDSAGGTPGQSLAGDALVSQALAGRYASRTDTARRGQVPEMHVAAPMTVDGKLVGVVYVSQPMRDVNAVLLDLRNRWLLSMAIAVVLSGVVGLLLSQAIGRPIRRLTAAAAAVAEGQLAQEVPVQSDDEIGRLSQAFNEMTARLRAAHRMQVDLVADVSHELRTPLTSVKGMVETLRDGAVEDYQVRDRFLETIETETDRLIRLVNDLLLLSRVDSGALNLSREASDLAQLVECAVGQVKRMARAQQVTLQVMTGDRALMAWVDPDRITQVLLNLLDNAVKYSGPGATIVVSVANCPERRAQVQVRDKGIGIPAEAMAHIGERFYRVDRARSRGQGGSGLGLAIARGIVEAHGGKLWLESEEGQGTTVTFSLPLL